MNTTALIAKKASVNLIKLAAVITASLAVTFGSVKAIAWVLVKYFNEMPETADIAAIPIFGVVMAIVIVVSYSIDKARLDVKLAKELEQIRNK